MLADTGTEDFNWAPVKIPQSAVVRQLDFSPGHNRLSKNGRSHSNKAKGEVIFFPKFWVWMLLFFGDKIAYIFIK